MAKPGITSVASSFFFLYPRTAPVPAPAPTPALTPIPTPIANPIRRAKPATFHAEVTFNSYKNSKYADILNKINFEYNNVTLL